MYNELARILVSDKADRIVAFSARKKFDLISPEKIISQRRCPPMLTGPLMDNRWSSAGLHQTV
jgi:hypothetical protein